MVYAYEPLCYYFGLTPKEYWENEIKENITYVQSNMAKKLDSLREQVQLFEIATNKLIKADAMSSKHPDIISIRDFYNHIFEKDKVTQKDNIDSVVNFFNKIIEIENRE